MQTLFRLRCGHLYYYHLWVLYTPLTSTSKYLNTHDGLRTFRDQTTIGAFSWLYAHTCCAQRCVQVVGDRCVGVEITGKFLNTKKYNSYELIGQGRDRSARNVINTTLNSQFPKNTIHTCIMYQAQGTTEPVTYASKIGSFGCVGCFKNNCLRSLLNCRLWHNTTNSLVFTANKSNCTA